AAVSTGKLRAVSAPEKADAFIIAVPTPVATGHTPDLSYIESAARSIAPVLDAGNLVILESTAPVGTGKKLSGWLSDLRPDLGFPHQAGERADVRVAYCPERILPGRMITELVENDRIIGGMTPPCADRAHELYKIFVRGKCILTDADSAVRQRVVDYLRRTRARSLEYHRDGEPASASKYTETRPWRGRPLHSGRPMVQLSTAHLSRLGSFAWRVKSTMESRTMCWRAHSTTL